MSDRIELFKDGMRRLAAGVSLITTRDVFGQPHGMIATSVTSVCLSPPSLLTCVNTSASSHDVLKSTGVFCVNILAEGADDIVRHFSSPKLRDSRFADDKWGNLETGSPVFDDAIASFDCRVTNAVKASSHTIFIGEVVAVRLSSEMIPPMLYLDGGFARCLPNERKSVG